MHNNRTLNRIIAGAMLTAGVAIAGLVVTHRSHRFVVVGDELHLVPVLGAEQWRMNLNSAPR